MFQDKRPNHLNGHGRVVREFTAVSTKDEFVMCFQFSDGSIGKAYERRAISDERMEVINHANKDRSGCYYTTRNEDLFSEGAIVNSCFEKKTREELDHEHLEYLCQVALDHIPLSRKQSVQCRHNLLSTMKHWLDVQIQNQSMQEYKKLAEIVAAYERELIPTKEETTMKNNPTPAPAPQREALPMQVDVKIHSLHASGPVLADASVNLNGCFAIRGVKVVSGTNGPFVSSSEEITLYSVSAPRGRAKTPSAPFLPPLPTEAHGGRASAWAPYATRPGTATRISASPAPRSSTSSSTRRCWTPTSSR